MCNECIKKGRLDELVVDRIVTSVKKITPEKGDTIILQYDGDYYNLSDVHDSMTELMDTHVKNGVAFLVIDKHYYIDLKKGVKPKDGDGYLLDLIDVMKPKEEL